MGRRARLRDDRVGNPETPALGSRQRARGRQWLRRAAIGPLRAADGVDGVLLHQDAIPDAEGHTRRAGGLADDDRHDRHRQQTRESDHPGQRRGGLRGIVARSGIEPRCIDQGDDRQLEVTGQAQHPLRFAEGARSRRLTPLAGDERRRDAADAAQPRDHRRIVISGAVAVQLDPLRDQTGEVIAGARPLGMTGKPGLLPPGNPAPRRDRFPGGETR